MKVGSFVVVSDDLAESERADEPTPPPLGLVTMVQGARVCVKRQRDGARRMSETWFPVERVHLVGWGSAAVKARETMAAWLGFQLGDVVHLTEWDCIGKVCGILLADEPRVFVQVDGAPLFDVEPSKIRKVEGPCTPFGTAPGWAVRSK
jgi:hypothetical protein